LNDIPELMRQRLASLSPDHIDIRDESNRHAGHIGAASGGGHFFLTIVSNHFAGLAAVARHQAVYQALGNLMTVHIHALSIKALTPDEL
jgi:BolA family transcriptional regulator, general stress-responsive regulator